MNLSSFANRSRKYEWTDDGKSFTNKRGPRILPCGGITDTIGSSLESLIKTDTYIDHRIGGSMVSSNSL